MQTNLKLLQQRVLQPKWWFRKGFRLASYLLLFDLAFVFFYPFIYMLTTSVKSPDNLADVSIHWIPSQIYLKNFQYAFENLNFKTTFFNSLFVVMAVTFGHLIGSSFIAYGFARFRFPTKKPMFAVLILSMIVPAQTIMVPVYWIYSNLGFVGSSWYAGIILPAFLGFGLKGGLFTFIFYSHFQTLPKSIEEAAYIDGASAVKTFFRIIVPSTLPAFLICGVLSAVWHWNDYFEPSIYISDVKRFLLPQMLPIISQMKEAVKTADSLEMLLAADKYNDAVMAASMLLSVLPLLIAYSFVQNKFIEGVVTTGLKE